MIDEAIRKINEEMQKSPSDRMLEAVGQYCIDLCTTEAAAKALLDEKKTLAGCRCWISRNAFMRASMFFTGRWERKILILQVLQRMMPSWREKRSVPSVRLFRAAMTGVSGEDVYMIFSLCFSNHDILKGL